MKYYDNLLDKAKKLHLSGKINEAHKLYSELIKEKQDDYLLLYLFGTTFLQLKKYNEAIKYLNLSIEKNSRLANSFNNRGIAYAENKNFKQAINDYDKAIELQKNNFDAHLNKAIALKNLHKFKEAITYFNLSSRLKPNNSKIYHNLGNLFFELNKFDQASKAYEKAIELNNNLTEIYGFLLHTKMHLNDWNNFDKILKKIIDEIKNDKKVIKPFPLLSLIDDPVLHKKVAIKYSKEKFLNIKNTKYKAKISKKIKLGYFSADFRSHPILELMVDVFKNHNKSLFEVYGFYHYSKKDKMTDVVSKYFNNFFYCPNLNDNEIASLSRENNIDIAIDLTGYTGNGRNDIFCYNPAPIKINYLGYPGTMGSVCYDYIIADKIILPKSEIKNYSEKIIYLPDCYQPNQEKIKTNTAFTKKDYKLPENSFVFGSLNNNYKITPYIFNSWMQILKKTHNSVLWLFQSNEAASKNIIQEALKHGISENRIIYAEKVSSSNHIQRLRMIDLFLDTFPYSAHTTAKQAVRMGVPVLTMIGKSFASRVASSILNYVNLKELITNDIDSYTNMAIEIANNKEKLKKLKNNLNRPKIIKKLHDCKKFTQELEKIYIKLSG